MNETNEYEPKDGMWYDMIQYDTDVAIPIEQNTM